MVHAEHGAQVDLVAEVAEGPVADVVQQAGLAQRLLHQRQRGRARLYGRQRGVHLARELPARCMVPRLCEKRLCSAVGNTHHELWS